MAFSNLQHCLVWTKERSCIELICMYSTVVTLGIKQVSISVFFIFTDQERLLEIKANSTAIPACSKLPIIHTATCLVFEDKPDKCPDLPPVAYRKPIFRSCDTVRCWMIHYGLSRALFIMDGQATPHPPPLLDRPLWGKEGSFAFVDVQYHLWTSLV